FATPSIEQLVEESLDMKVVEAFSWLDSEPLASASIAQVHKATLINGDEVVVKVRRPGIEHIVSADIKLLKWLAQLIESRTSLGKRLHPIEVVADYERIIFDELNLRAEGANTSHLKRNFQDSTVLYVPRVYWDYTRSNMLVMERIYGIPVTDVASLLANGTNMKRLAETGVNIFFTQVFEHNFFHADMHPGNIFVSRENPDNPKYIAIDCAIIGTLSDADQEYLAKNLLAIFKRDYRRVAELHVECGWVPQHTRVGEFETAIRSVCEPIFEKPLKDISFAHVLVELFRTAGRFDMEVQPSLVLLQKTLLNIEGLGRQLYPELDLWETALPFLERWNRKRLSPFTLFDKVRGELPNWIDQLPQFPAMVLEALQQTRQLEAINSALRQQQRAEQQRHEQRRRRTRNGGILALILAALAAVPSVATALQAAPLLPAGLGLLGVYLLCFTR
ncbi:MAG: AarF/UbiB family protein, partial [Pseudohongiellaceae bacterium]